MNIKFVNILKLATVAVFLSCVTEVVSSDNKLLCVNKDWKPREGCGWGIAAGNEPTEQSQWGVRWIEDAKCTDIGGIEPVETQLARNDIVQREVCKYSF